MRIVFPLEFIIRERCPPPHIWYEANVSWDMHTHVSLGQLVFSQQYTTIKCDHVFSKLRESWLSPIVCNHEWVKMKFLNNMTLLRTFLVYCFVILRPESKLTQALHP